MSTFFVWFWTAMIFLSILWYGVLLFYVGIKGGFEIVRMTASLSAKAAEEKAAEEAARQQRLPSDSANN